MNFISLNLVYTPSDEKYSKLTQLITQNRMVILPAKLRKQATCFLSLVLTFRWFVYHQWLAKYYLCDEIFEIYVFELIIIIHLNLTQLPKQIIFKNFIMQEVLSSPPTIVCSITNTTRIEMSIYDLFTCKWVIHLSGIFQANTRFRPLF